MSHAKYLEADIDNMKHQRVAVNSGEGFLQVAGFPVYWLVNAVYYWMLFGF